ncbi:DUF4440 domain-containing protein, partial [Candidatus Poribacteria bacterium]|nr:DUF4440 domain-containing protein [Candidatus Poribacteria bacterium]
MRQNLARLPKADLVQALHDEPNLNGCNLKNVDLSSVNLARVNLSGARLHSADLSGSYLHSILGRYTSFVGANMRGVAAPAAALEGAGFGSANLHSADLRWADLTDSSLVGADLGDAQLLEAKLTAAVLTDANLEGAGLESVDLNGAILRDAKLSNAVLHSATLKKADLYGADLRRCDLRGADLSGANMFGVQMEGAVHDESTVFPGSFDPSGLGMHFLAPGADLARTDLNGFDFRGEDLSGADLSRSNLVGSDLRGADLDGADLTGTRIRTTLYDAETRFPQGFDPPTSGMYAIVPRTVIRFAKLQWKRLRDAALSGSQLEGADLTGADLTGAQLNSANLVGATLYSANLTGAGLHGTTLRGANARGAILQEADLRRADLRDGDFSWADFAEADLRGTQLAGASLAEARLRGARYDERTAFPAGFDPVAARMMDGDIAQTPKRAERGGETDRRPAFGIAAFSPGEWIRAAKAFRASSAQVYARAVRGPLVIVSGSVGLFLVAGWYALGIHPTPEPSAHPAMPAALASASVAQGREESAGPVSLLAAGTTIRGSAPIVVDFEQIQAPATRPAGDVVVMAPIPSVATDMVDTLVAAAPAPVVAARPQESADTNSPVPTPSPTVVARTSEQSAATADDASDPLVAAVPPAPQIAPEPKPVATSASGQTAPVAAMPTDGAGPESASEVDSGVAATASEIVAAVDQWRSAWEARDAAAYAELYHQPDSLRRASVGRRSIGHRQFTKARLAARANDVFSAYDRVKVDIENLHVSREGDLVVSSFDEDFIAWRADAGAAPDYVDRGRTTLVYVRDARNEWRIVA